MSGNDIRTKGLSELNQFLDRLPSELATKVVRGSMREGAKLFLEEAQRNCPVGAPSTEGARLYGLYRGALRDSLRLATSVKNLLVKARVIAGGRRKGVDVWYTHIIEYTGAVPHVIKAKPGMYLFMGRTFRSAVQHPGMRAKAFLRPALYSLAQAAIVATAESMKRKLSRKHGFDTAGVDVGAGEKG